jgi:hypothetical protein
MTPLPSPGLVSVTFPELVSVPDFVLVARPISESFAKSISFSHSPAPGAPAYPLKISANGHQLVDQNNHPFLITGDAPHDLLCMLSPSDADYYFADRQNYGYNAAWVEILTDPYVNCSSNGSTYDGIQPFTSTWDFTKPNPVYFARLDSYINLAAKHGITVLLDSWETGGLTSYLVSQGATVAFNYGAYLGNRYKNFPNIIWITGNDYTMSSGSDPVFAALMEGIRSADPNHIQTIEYQPNQTALDNSTISLYAKMNSVYEYGVTYPEMWRAYNQSAGKAYPPYLLEAHYELENVGGEYGSPLVVRKQGYWAMLAGGSGQMYGNHYSWTFESGWQQQIDSPGASQISIWKTFFESYRWYDLIPDQGHAIITSGYGTLGNNSTSVGSNDYATASRLSDGSLVMAYIPMARTFTVNMAKLSGSVTARWFDPTSGSYATVSGSPFANTGSRQFTTPGNNAAGDPDWVLVLSH